MAINELPENILVHILSFLSRSDRLESALTCRRWAQAVAQAPPLLRDIWLVIGKLRQLEAVTVFAKSHRQYENLRFENVYLLHHTAEFWTNIGPTLRKLEIIECTYSLEEFYSILQACSNLESLRIQQSGTTMFHDILGGNVRGYQRPHDGTKTVLLSELPRGINVERIQRSMRNLRHLHLDFFVNADILEHLFNLMPNVSSIALTKLDKESDLSGRLRNILGTSRKITALGSNRTSITPEDCEQVLGISSPNLRFLKYSGGPLAPTVFETLRNCSMLRDLHLHWWPSDDTHLLQNILRNIPELESLSISNFRSSREDLMPIFDLRNLRKLELHVKLLNLTMSDTYVLDEIVVDLSRMISLESLTLGEELGIVNSTHFRILANMPNLRELVICKVRWNAEFLAIILSLRNLKTLEIQWYVPSLLIPDRLNTVASQDRFRSDRQGEQELSSLETLTMYCIPLTDACLGRIAARHSQLKIVCLKCCYGVTGAGLVTLLQHESLLEQLHVSYMEQLDGTFLGHLGDKCRRLRSLKLVNILGNRISSQAWEEFRLRRPRVKCNVW